MYFIVLIVFVNSINTLYEVYMNWEEATFKNSKRKLIHVTLPGGYKGIVVGDPKKYNVKKTKKR